MTFVLIGFLLTVTLWSCSADIDKICSKATDCRSCMNLHPACHWCYSNPYGSATSGPGYRCATKETLEKRDCSKFLTETMSSTPTTGKASQIQPVTLTSYLRPKKTYEFEFNYTQEKDYPLDIYLLTDVSHTMKDDLQTVSKQSIEIARQMKKVTSRFRIGFGTFVDKPVVPFVSPLLSDVRNPCKDLGAADNIGCVPPYLYKHVVSLTSDISVFQKATSSEKSSGNLDNPEGGLDALLQVAYCSDVVGWDSKSRKIVLFATDGPCHTAGDGRLAGLVEPPPKKCVVTREPDRFNNTLIYQGWHHSTYTDYPSVGEVARVLSEKDIGVIFASSKLYKTIYTQLAKMLPVAEVGIIENNSQNIIDLIMDNYNKIASTVKVALSSYDTNFLDIKILTRCSDETEFTEKSKCLKHPRGKSISYKLQITVKECFENSKEFVFKLEGFQDQATIRIQSACNCSACLSEPVHRASPFCSSQGNLKCGECQCNTGYTGDICECSKSASSESKEDQLNKCISRIGTEVCSGRGRCSCGKCLCNSNDYEGDYCECDKKACKQASDDGQVCGGKKRGECQCNGKCKCNPQYSGEACDCVVSQENCRNKNNASAPLCSGHGDCDCGICFCNAGRTGNICDEIQGGEGQQCKVEVNQQCIKCLYDAKAEEKVDSCPVCNRTDFDLPQIVITNKDLQDENQEENVCLTYDGNCKFYWSYRYPTTMYAERKILVRIGTKKCESPVPVWIIIAAVIGGIVGIGIILLLIWKLVVTIDDKRELAKFENDTKNAKWEMEENPIFEKPVTTITNPMYTGGVTD